MHQFWEIDEMVRLVASDLEKRCDASASAIALACCSKRLNDITLDILWEELEGLGLLMKCLPPDTWGIRNEKFTFLRCPSTKEWIRLSSYAYRVRKLCVYDGHLGISLAAYHLLSMQTQTLGQYLLPNLRSIHWEPHSWGPYPFLRLLLNPELIDVTIEFPDDNPHIYRPATVSLIPTAHLAHLNLQPIKDDLSMEAFHNLLDGASETLRSVVLYEEPSMAVVKKLLQLPYLRHLDIKLPGTRISPPAPVFPSLEKLVVDYGEACSWLHIFRSIPNPKLRELVSAFKGSSPVYLQTLGSSLLDASIEQTLTSLDCHCNGIPLTEAGLHPLLSFGRLTTLDLFFFCIEKRCSFQLNDSIISELAAALPQLTHLGLGGDPCNVPPSDVTITSLASLSANCLDLNSLRLHFNTNDIVSRDTHGNSQTRKSTCKLRTLSVGFLPPPSGRNDTLLVAFVILHLFPYLDIISSAGRCWDQVREDVQLLRKAQRITTGLQLER